MGWIDIVMLTSSIWFLVVSPELIVKVISATLLTGTAATIVTEFGSNELYPVFRVLGITVLFLGTFFCAFLMLINSEKGKGSLE
jgi:hypothetical protein